jgi:uncharacterized protein
MANSLHCAGMCGPLAACFMGGKSGAVGYHGSRLVSYAILGAVAGAVGTVIGRGTAEVPVAWISIALAVVLLAIASGMPRVFTGSWTPPFLGRLFAKARSLPPFSAGVCVGLITPLLPCGVLYIVAGTALASGSAEDGAAALLAFALGSLPILLLTQMNLGWLSGKLSVRGRSWLFRGLMVAAAGVLLFRGVADLYGTTSCH